MPNAETIYRANIAITADSQVAAGFERAKVETRGGLLSLQSILKQNAPAITLAGSAALAKSIIDATLVIERLKNTLKTVTGSVEAAAAEMSFVREESNRLGLELENTASQYAKLAAASKGTVLEGEETRRIFVAVSEAAAVLGLSADEAGGALQAIQQIISKGKVQAEELRGQLGERLPGAFQIAARAMGITTQQLDKLLSDGKITAEDLLPRLAAELRKTFGAGVADAANSTQASINRMKNAWLDLKVAFADTGFAKATATSLEFLTGRLNDFSSLLTQVRAKLGSFATPALEFESLEGSVRGLSEALARSTGRQLGEIAGATSAQIEQIGRESTSAAVRGAAAGLLEARKQLQEFLNNSRGGIGSGPSGIIPPKGGDKNNRNSLAGASLGGKDKSTDEVRAFIEGVEKQSAALRQSLVGLESGEAAAKAYGIAQEFAGLQAKKLVSPENERAFREQLKTFKDLNTELERRKALLDRQAIDEADLAEGRKAAEAARLAPFKAADDLTVQRQGEAAERAARDFDDIAEATREWNEVQVESGRISDQMTRSLAEVSAQAQVFGDNFDVIGARLAVVRAGIHDYIAEQVRLKGAVSQGDETLVQFRETLRGLESDQTIERAFDDVGQHLAGSLTGILDQTSSFGEKMRDLVVGIARSVGNSFSDEIGKQISGGLKDLLLGKDNGSGRTGGLLSSAIEFLRGGNILQSGAQSAASGAVNGTSSNAAGVVAVESLSTLAQTALEASALASQTSIEALSAVAVGSLESATAVSVAGIGAVEAAALAAIAAAAAGGGGGSGGEIVDDALSGLFDLIGSFDFHNGGPVKRFAVGGTVLGSGEVPAILHTGEFVLRKQIVDAIGVESLQRINRGGLPAFELGGLVMASNPIRSTRPADLKAPSTDRGGAHGMGQKTEVHVHGSIIKNPDVPEDRVIQIITRDYRSYGATRAVIRGDR